MQTSKMSLANIQGKLSRAEMKHIMAGSGEGTSKCCVGTVCTDCVRNGGITCAAGATRFKC